MAKTGMQGVDLQEVDGLPETKESKNKTGVKINTKVIIATIVIIIIAAAGGVGGMLYVDKMGQWISTNNAFVDGNIYIVTSAIPGIVESIKAAENSPVSKGDPLIGLDSRMYQVADETVNKAIETNRISIDALGYGRSVILSPYNGYLSQNLVRPGEFITAEQPILYVVNIDVPWITANIYETQIKYIRVGQNVEIHIDAYPNVRFEGRIESIAPAVGGTFALFPPDATAGNWVRTTQRIPVKISFVEAIDQDIKLHIGMLARVRIER